MDKELKKLRAKMAELHEQMAAITAGAGDRDLTDEEQTQVSGLMAQYNEAKAEAEALEEKISQQATLLQQVADTGAELEQSTGRTVAAVTPVGDTVTQDVTPLTSGVRPRLLDDPQGGFRDYGEFCQAVIAGSRPGAKPDERLLIVSGAYGQNIDTGSEGGFLAPPEFSNQMVARMNRRLGLVGRADVISMTSNYLKFTGLQDHDRSSTSYRYGGVIVYMVGEGKQITRSTLKTRAIELKLHKMCALSYSTYEEIQAVANMGSRLLDAHGGALGDTIEEQMMFGTGVNQLQGAFSAPCCVEAAKETGQAADTIVAENIAKMEETLAEESLENAEWFYNSECFSQLVFMVVNVGTGGSALMVTGRGLEGKPFRTILGRPSTATNKCEALGDAGDICLGDFSKYVLGMRGTVDTAMSVHLRFDYAETAFRSIVQVDGQPYYAQALTPRKGASGRTVSPFVKLAERA